MLKRQQQALQKQKEFQQSHQLNAVYGLSGQGPVSHARELFRVSKDWSNAPAGFEDSQAQRAIEIRRMMEQQRNPKHSLGKSGAEPDDGNNVINTGEPKPEKPDNEGNEDEIDATDTQHIEKDKSQIVEEDPIPDQRLIEF